MRDEKQTLDKRIMRIQRFIEKWDGETRQELIDHAKSILKKLEKEKKGRL